MPIAIKAAQDRSGKPRKTRKSLGWKILFTRRGLVWVGGGAVVLVLLFMTFGVSRLKYAPLTQTRGYGALYPATPTPKAQSLDGHQTTLAGKEGDAAYSYTLDDNLSAPGNASRLSQPTFPSVQDKIRSVTKSGTATEHESTDGEIDNSERTLDLPTVPMIARTAGLTLTTKEFDKTRASLEETLKRHGGYLGELKVSAPADAGRTLTATLRIPAPQLEQAMAELKKLGRVEDESQGGEEVTQQYVDLQARLANGKHTEQRLTEILRTRTGKLQDVLKVELEIDRVRGEIEQMQAEKKELSKRVAFATLNTMVKEEYHAKLEAAPPSTGSRFRNAAVDGYNTVVEGLIDVGLFLLSVGPSLLLWAAILFFPARWAWKKLRRKAMEPETHSAQ